jgi:CIC family chloride channel protein
MTGNYKIILPLMITCIISTVVAGRFTKESIYTLKLRRRGIDLQKMRRADLMERITVSEAMVKDMATFDEFITIKNAELTIKSDDFYRHRGFPVLDLNGNLAGMITRKDIGEALARSKADILIKEIMTKDITVAYPDENLRTALQKLGMKDIGRIPVVERTEPCHLIGLITRENIIAAYNSALEEKGS